MAAIQTSQQRKGDIEKRRKRGSDRQITKWQTSKQRKGEIERGREKEEEIFIEN